MWSLFENSLMWSVFGNSLMCSVVLGGEQLDVVTV